MKSETKFPSAEKTIASSDEQTCSLSEKCACIGLMEAKPSYASSRVKKRAECNGDDYLERRRPTCCSSTLSSSSAINYGNNRRVLLLFCCCCSALLATLQQQTIDVQQLPLMAMPTTPRVLYGTSPPPKMLQLRQPRPRRLLIKIALTGQTSSYHCQLASSYVFVFPKKNIKARPYRPSNYSCT